jgi:hypothetical protein
VVARRQTLAGLVARLAWLRIVKIARGFAEYQRKTDRELPVIGLSPSLWHRLRLRQVGFGGTFKLGT